MNESNNPEKETDLYTSTILDLKNRHYMSIIHKSLNLFLTKNYKEAEIVLVMNLLETIFNDIEVQYLMGHIKLKLKDFKHCFEYFCGAIDKENSLLPEILCSKGLAYLMEKDYKAAVRNFKKACNNTQNNFHFHNHLALAYKIIYNSEKDEKKKLLDVEDESSDSSNNFSDIISSSKSDNYEQKTKKNFKKNKNNHFMDSTNLTEHLSKIRTKYKEAFLEALNINPNSYISLLNLGTVCVEEGEIDQAGKYYKKAELINKQSNSKKDWKIYINLAFLAFKEKEYPLSMGYFEILFKSFENKVDIKALNIYMICLYQNKEWKKLERIAKKVLKLDKKNKKAVFYLITSLEKNKKYEDLFFFLKKVKSKMKLIKQKYITESSRQSKSKSEKEIEQQFKSPLFKYEQLKQIIKKKLKKVNEDLRIEHQGIFRSQNADSTLEDLGMDNLRSFGFKKDYIEKILVLQSKNKDNLESLFNLGYIYYKEEEYLKSEEYFRRVIELNPEYKKNLINEYLGDIYLEQYDSPAKALSCYNRAYSAYFNSSIFENNISASNINNNNTLYGQELLLVKIGLCYANLEDNESALKYYKLALKKNPDFVNAIFHMGCIYDKMNKQQEALNWLEIAYEKEKENVDYLQKYGDCLVNSSKESDISKGILILERGKDFFTGNIEVISSLAKGYEKQGRLIEAINLLETAKNNEDFINNKSTIFQLAYYYEKNKELTKALEYFKKVLYLDKNNVDSLLHIGYIYRSIKENVKAFKCFKQILKIDKNNYLAYYGLGRLYQSLDNHDTEAINCYKNSVSLNPESIKANLQLGIIYLKIKECKESLKYLKKVIDLDPKNILGLVALGNVHLEMKQYNEAMNYLESALKLDKDNISANAALGDVYFATNEIDDAMEKYFTVNRINDQIPQVNLNLAHCQFMLEKFDRAITYYIKAIQLVKNTRHDYYYYLGNALICNFKYKDAIMAYQAAIKLKPSKLNYYYAIGKACFLGKLNKKGIKYIEKLLHLEKDKTINKDLLEAEREYKFNEALFLLFKLYYTLPEPDYNKCLNIIKNLIRNEPKNIKYLEILASLQEKKSNFFEAAKVYRQILSLEPLNLEARRKLNLLDLNENASDKSQIQISNKTNVDHSSKSSESESCDNSDSESSKNKSSSIYAVSKNTKNEDSKSKSLINEESKSRESKSRNKRSESRIKSFNISSSKQSIYNKTNTPMNNKSNENIEDSKEEEKNE